MNNYKETTEEKERQFKELKEKDEASALEIDKAMRRIQKHFVCMHFLKSYF